MDRIFRSFFKGLLIVIPFVLTAMVVVAVVGFVDHIVPARFRPFPGFGVLLTLALVTLVGFGAGNAIGRRVLRILEHGFERTPVVKLVYSSVKDLLGAFVGDKKSFDSPVMVALTEDGNTRALGFVTARHFDDPKLAGHVAVYLPQSYNFAGNLIVVPESRVERIDADSAQFMAFIVSGGVADMKAARTVMEGSSPLEKR